MIRVYTVGVKAPHRDQRRGDYFEPADEHSLTALVDRLPEKHLREIVVTGVPGKPLDAKFVANGGVQVKRRKCAWSLRTHSYYRCYGTVLDDVLWLSKWHEAKEEPRTEAEAA